MHQQVLVWSPYRTSSTWLVNVISEMTQRSGLRSAIWYLSGPDNSEMMIEDLSTVDRVVMKAHYELTYSDVIMLQSLFPLKVFTSLREGDAVARSWFRITQESPHFVLTHNIRAMREILRAINHGLKTSIVYECEAREGKLDVYKRLNDELGTSLSDETISQIADEFAQQRLAKTVDEMTKAKGLRTFREGFDQKTLWHRNHIKLPGEPEPEFEFDSEIIRLINEHDLLSDAIIQATKNPTIDAPDLSIEMMIEICTQISRREDLDRELGDLKRQIENSGGN